MWARWDHSELVVTFTKVESALLAKVYGDNEDAICQFLEDVFAEGIDETTKREAGYVPGKKAVAAQGDAAS